MKILITSSVVTAFVLFASVACNESNTPTAQDRLAEMDERQPVPLLPMMANHQKENMRDHLTAVQEIIQALSVQDFAGVEKAATRISSSDDYHKMCAKMGAGASGFTEMGMSFHSTADSIITAAKTKNSEATLKALSDTIARCTACHSTYRQAVMNQDEWDLNIRKAK